LPLALLLPQRKKISRLVVESPNQVFVHTIEYLIDFSLTKIEHPLNVIPETPARNFSEPDDFFEEEGFNPPQNNQPWLAIDSLAIPGLVHNLPRHLKKLLPKFDPETSGFPEDHIKKIILAIRLMNVQHEDVV
jgi:hypothetical protein